jgi:hypothetical protein
MANLNSFLAWFQNLGGDQANANIDKLHTAVNEPVLRVSTFKNRAKEIKEKYNHKFIN